MCVASFVAGATRSRGGVDSTTDVAILQSLEFVTPYEFEANNKHLYLVLIGVFCVTLPP